MKIAGWFFVSVAFLFSCQRAQRSPHALAASRASRYELEIGKQVFQGYCAGCHGDGGQGDGFNSFNLDPHPRDLSSAAFQKSKTDAELADTIRRGGSGVGLSSLMPPWGHTLDDRQVAAVVLYIRTLKPNP